MQNTHLFRNICSTLMKKNPFQPANITSVRWGSFKVQDEKAFLEKVQNSKEPVIVDFFADWCGPCRALTPRLETAIAKSNGKINLAKVDVDDLGELAAKFEVSTIPALVVFKNGKVTGRLVGLQEQDKLENWIDTVLNDKSKSVEHQKILGKKK